MKIIIRGIKSEQYPLCTYCVRPFNEPLTVSKQSQQRRDSNFKCDIAGENPILYEEYMNCETLRDMICWVREFVTRKRINVTILGRSQPAWACSVMAWVLNGRFWCSIEYRCLLQPLHQQILNIPVRGKSGTSVVASYAEMISHSRAVYDGKFHPRPSASIRTVGKITHHVPHHPWWTWILNSLSTR